MQCIRYEGKQRFCSRIEFHHPNLLVQFSHSHAPRRGGGEAGVSITSPMHPPMQVKVDLNCLQVNLWTYFTISNIAMLQRLINVSLRLFVRPHKIVVLVRSYRHKHGHP